MLIVFVNASLCLDVFRDLMKAEMGFARPLVPSFLSSGKYRNCLRENVIVGAEKYTVKVSH